MRFYPELRDCSCGIDVGFASMLSVAALNCGEPRCMPLEARVNCASMFACVSFLGGVRRLGLADNTLVIFTSDHGAAPVAANRENVRRCYLFGCPGPFDGGKHDLSEGGIRYQHPLYLSRSFPPHARGDTFSSFFFGRAQCRHDA